MSANSTVVVPVARGAAHVGVEHDLHSVALERRAHRGADVGIVVAQQLGPVLKQRDARSESREELRERAADRSAADDRDRARRLGHLEHVGARDGTYAVEPFDRRRDHGGARRDDEALCGDAAAADRDRVGSDEARVAAHERVLREIVQPVFGEIVDQRALAADDRRQVHRHGARVDADVVRLAHLALDLRRGEHRLRRHAAAQDARPAQLLGARDEDEVAPAPRAASAAVKPAVPAPITQSSCRSSPIHGTVPHRGDDAGGAAERLSESNRCSITCSSKSGVRWMRDDDSAPKIKAPSLPTCTRSSARSSASTARTAPCCGRGSSPATTCAATAPRARCAPRTPGKQS